MAYSGGKEKRVNSTTAGSQTDPEVTRLDDGGWLVSWTSYGQDGSSGGIYQQRYNADGAKSGGENLVPTITSNNQFQSHVTSLTDGGWVVAWTSMTPDPNTGAQVRLQAYNGTAPNRASKCRPTRHLSVNSRRPRSPACPMAAGS